MDYLSVGIRTGKIIEIDSNDLEYYFPENFDGVLPGKKHPGNIEELNHLKMMEAYGLEAIVIEIKQVECYDLDNPELAGRVYTIFTKSDVIETANLNEINSVLMPLGYVMGWEVRYIPQDIENPDNIYVEKNEFIDKF